MGAGDKNNTGTNRPCQGKNAYCKEKLSNQVAWMERSAIRVFACGAGKSRISLRFIRATR
jgi:hypothetical protein